MYWEIDFVALVVQPTQFSAFSLALTEAGKRVALGFRPVACVDAVTLPQLSVPHVTIGNKSPHPNVKPQLLIDGHKKQKPSLIIGEEQQGIDQWTFGSDTTGRCGLAWSLSP